MPLQIEYRDLDALAPYPKNPRTHSADQIKQIERSLAKFGWAAPMAVADGVLIYGHARREAAINLRRQRVKIPLNDDPNLGPVVDLSHLSPSERKAYVIADNQLAALAGWDDELLSMELSDLRSDNFDLSVLGFDADELSMLLDPIEEVGDNADGLLDLADITNPEPRHKVEAGEHWVLDGRHHLFCASVIEDHAVWARHLKSGTLFLPYPGPLCPFGEKAKEHVLVMVQPDAYAAAVMLDRFVEMHGEMAIARMSA